MIHVHQARDQSHVLLEFSGALDTRAAEELATAALQQPMALHLVIDISRATNINDAALGRLIESLPAPRGRTIRGGNRHHQRLLEDLGEHVDDDEVAHTD